MSEINLETLLKTDNKRSFSKKWISHTNKNKKEIIMSLEFLKSIGTTDDKINTFAEILFFPTNTLKENYNNLREKGFKKEQISKRVNVLSRNSKTINKTFNLLVDLEIKKEKILSNINLLTLNEKTIKDKYQNLIAKDITKEKISLVPELLFLNINSLNNLFEKLLKFGFSKEQIVNKPQILGRNYDTLKQRFEHHTTFFKNDNITTETGKEALLNNSTLLNITDETFEANIQWFYANNITNYNTRLLGTKLSTKRKKVVWLLKNVFGYENTLPKQEKKLIINATYDLIRHDSQLLLKSTKALNEMKDQLINRANKYLTRPIEQSYNKIMYF